MLISHLLAAFQRWRKYTITVSELSQLTDRELLDLGITRYDIRAIAKDAAAQH